MSLFARPARERGVPAVVAVVQSIVVEDLARTRLKRCVSSPPGQIRCEYEGGSLTVRGRVSSHAVKRFVREVLAGIAGVRAVVLQLEVDETEETPPFSPGRRG